MRLAYLVPALALLTLTGCLPGNNARAVVRVQLDGESPEDEQNLAQTIQGLLQSRTTLSRANDELGLTNALAIPEGQLFWRMNRGIRVIHGEGPHLFVLRQRNFNQQMAVGILNSYCNSLVYYDTNVKLTVSINNGPSKRIHVEILQTAQ